MKFYLLQEMFVVLLSVAILFGAGVLVLVILILLQEGGRYALSWSKVGVACLASTSFRRSAPRH
jgi:hypothetical protein